MRFGHFFYPMSLDPNQNTRLIDDCLYEAELVEELGLDAVWFAEHHFAGEVAYGDPLVFATAVAARTRKVLLGFGVVEMAFHNPVQLAIQTALLDILSQGRLIVGTGRGSNFNSFEYVGFGTSVEKGRRHLAEAEDLLVKAWTTENLEFKGEVWQVSFPSIRPRPYQKPHPPLARACMSDQSIAAMGQIGRPILLSRRSTESAAAAFQLYRDTMLSSGFDEAAVECALDESWVWRELYLAETDDEAMDEFIPAYDNAISYINGVRDR